MEMQKYMCLTTEGHFGKVKEPSIFDLVVRVNQETLIAIPVIVPSIHSCNCTSHSKMWTLTKTLRSNSNRLAFFISEILI